MRAKRRLTDKQRDLAAEHWPRALRTAKAFKKRCPYMPTDFESAAAIGLCNAAYSYRGQGYHFWTYAKEFVVGECVQAIRRCGLRGYITTDDAVDPPPRVFSIEMVDAELSRWYHGDSEVDARDFVYSLTCVLRPLSREVMRLHCCEGLSTTQIAERLGIHQDYVRLVRLQAIKYLRESVHLQGMIQRAS